MSGHIDSCACRECVARQRHRDRQKRHRQRKKLGLVVPRPRRPKPAPPKAIGDVVADVVAPHLPGAACLGRWALFDAPEPDEDDDDQGYRIDRAKALCRSCPALDPCRSWLDTLPAKDRPSGVVAGRLITEGAR